VNPEHPKPQADGSPRHTALWFLFLFAVFGFVLVFSGQCALDRFTARAYPLRELPPEPTAQLLPSPERDDEYWPCGDCHEGQEVVTTPRELEEHDFKISHGDLWCFDCHDVERQDLLRISAEGLVEVDESWRLCTRCHGEKLADWRAGVHGKRTGHWRGPKEYRTCVSCHRPHSPRFGQLEPKPRPLRSEEIRARTRDRKEAAGE
jgi:hypothetical protein